MNLQTYINNLNTRYGSGISTEHSFRGDLQALLEALLPDVLTTNEPTRIACGAPDYILSGLKDNIPIGYIEAKDLGADLNAKAYQAQFDRYKAALPNLILTNYLQFQIFKEGVLVTELSIGAIAGGKVISQPENFELLIAQLKNFALQTGQTIQSASVLAAMMATKAKMLSSTINAALTADEAQHANSTLRVDLNTIREFLIRDLKIGEFADIYAQTIAYGMFAARLHDPSVNTFSRRVVAELIPKTNPLLRLLFNHVAGINLDKRIVWIVDALADIFKTTDLKTLLKDFGKNTQQNDPIIHFYETFLAEYDPKLRKIRGVWYTPQPVVNFMVRAIDELLQSEFNLPAGLADNSKVTIKLKLSDTDKRYKAGQREYDQEVHQVQILDPATGTGTFLAQIVKHIYYTRFEGQQGAWNSYVDNYLIPRLNGFELLMAPYAMAHINLDMLLAETGYASPNDQRLRVYLTNSLEESHAATNTLFAAEWLSNEANEANYIKRDAPIMVVMGNPPYSGESANKNEWINLLLEDYKREPEGKQKLKEHNPKWLNDDYVKFLRYGQHYIEKNGSGVVAFINPHGFLDNPTFRGMRWNLLKTYDKIYVIDLHGNTRKKERAAQGTVDENVFDIMQGVSINIFVKTGKKLAGELGQVYHYHLHGRREAKFDFLLKNSLKTVQYDKIINKSPNYFFVNKDFGQQKTYTKGFSLNALFPLNSVGIVTARDSFTIKNSRAAVKDTIDKFVDLDPERARYVFKLGEDKRDWKVAYAKQDLIDSGMNFGKIIPITYRPFDLKYTYYTGKSKGFHCMPRNRVMQHFIKGKNIGLAVCRQFRSGTGYTHVFICNRIMESSYLSNRTSEITYLLPLYQYSGNALADTATPPSRQPNLNADIVKQIAKKLKLKFTAEKEASLKAFAPIDLLDYVYAILHSTVYRERYKEFLKIDFPIIPYPKDASTFWALVALGGQLRELHLLESPLVAKLITQYPIGGDNEVAHIKYEAGRVYINDTQYFADVPAVAWEYWVGAYQPAQKWLKDRKGSVLSYEDIQHYQQMIVALTETNKLMQAIAGIAF